MLISQYFYPEMISTGHVLTELLVELTVKGAKCSVICAQPTYYANEKVDSRITYKGIDIIRTRNTQYDKNSIKGKLLNSASFFLLAMRLAWREHEVAPVLLVTNPPFLGLMGPIMKAVKRRPFILIIHDLYPDLAVNLGYLSRKSPITVLWKWLNRWIFREASFIVVLGRDVKRVIQNRMPLKHRDKVVYIPNWADPSLIHPMEPEKDPFVKQLGLQGKFLVQYSGNMGLTHDMETIIEAAWELRKDDSVHFIMIGGGGKLAKIKEMARSYKLWNVSFLPYQRRENLKKSLGAAHVSLISLENGAQGLSVPSKLYGILASGRPAIAIMAENSEVAMALEEFKCGLVTPPKDVPGLVQKITWLRDNEAERKSMGARSYRAFLNNFTVQRCADEYHCLIKQMLS